MDEVENDHRLCEQFHSSKALTLYALMDSSFWFDTINLECSTKYTEGLHLFYFQIKLYFSEDGFCLNNAALCDFHLGLHCLPKYTFRSH